MSYLDANFGGASDLPQNKNRAGSAWLLWWIVGAGIVGVVLVAVFRPHWLGKVGSQIFGQVANPMGWV